MRENPRLARASVNTLVKTQLVGIRKEISEHEKAVSAFKKEEKNISIALKLLTGKASNVGRPGKKKATTSTGRIDWNATLKSLPPKFSLDDLAKKEAVKGKNRHYLQQMVGRWKKTGSIMSVGKAKYQKA